MITPNSGIAPFLAPNRNKLTVPLYLCNSRLFKPATIHTDSHRLSPRSHSVLGADLRLPDTLSSNARILPSITESTIWGMVSAADPEINAARPRTYTTLWDTMFIKLGI